MYVIAKYIAIMAENRKPSRKILTNCLIELEDSMIKSIKHYEKYDIVNGKYFPAKNGNYFPALFGK